jgi:hypothetical protein
MPDGQPAFFVEVYPISRYGEKEPRLRWAGPPADRYALMGDTGVKYACYPVHDGGVLLPEMPPAPPPAPRVPWPFPVSAHQETT